jgi:hypothetical protein
MIGAMIGAMLIYLTLIVDSIWLNLIGVMSTEGKCPQFIKGYTSTHLEINLKHRCSMIQLQTNFIDDIQDIIDCDKCIWS